jgi:hypothetical protein
MRCVRCPTLPSVDRTSFDTSGVALRSVLVLVNDTVLTPADLSTPRRESRVSYSPPQCTSALGSQAYDMEVSSEVEVPLRQRQRDTPSARRLDGSASAAADCPQSTTPGPSRPVRPHKRKLSLLRGDSLTAGNNSAAQWGEWQEYRCPPLPRLHEHEE